ncbi:MAG: DUF3081 domain-containing protein [Cohaesibacter sp.]|nr:DUF3081 domain-containing protein [Cohaesibacter sp.]MCV6601425.1 DUF3081 domain-containing protein [Cohaesibacter sp.]
MPDMSYSAFDTDLKLEVAKALSVFNRIIKQGERQKNGHHLFEGMHAEMGYDGYTVSLYDAGARLDIFFHNKFKMSFETNKQKQSFLRKLDAIYEMAE